MKNARLLRLALLAALALWPGPGMGAETQGAQAVKTTTKSSVQVQITDQAGTTLLNVQGNDTAAGAGGAAQVLAGNVESTLPTYTAGHVGMPTIDLGGRTYVTTDAAANLRENITQVGGSTIAIGQAASAASFPVVIASDQSNVPANIKQVNGATLSLGQTTKSASLPVTLASDQGTLSVTQGAPTGATTALSSAVTIAASATSTITCVGSLATTQPVKLSSVHINGSGSAHCTIQYDSNASLTKWGAVETSAASPTGTFACPFGYCAVTSGASGTQAIEASCTNLDAASGQDFTCDVQYCQAASGC